jgi:hypothetical protein
MHLVGIYTPKKITNFHLNFILISLSSVTKITYPLKEHAPNGTFQIIITRKENLWNRNKYEDAKLNFKCLRS